MGVLHNKGIQSILEVHKRCHNCVGVGRWRVEHRSERSVYLACCRGPPSLGIVVH